ncbi:trigger factor [Candidatus Falkowbacteria bacterium CG11_big_fil_rev_8_21_14_0_20_39_10]|uniref:Trigger factor n=1 Tax=Candidatus Falkowbacteria bacterium CG11_big_fil_rev_8_21_14_0_20_39_10 TaxID=1974570 RepID=A0A2M6K9K5_9BACT|nr:MAG: trigger factor [Candidatus Falkowbacteria bacterium CG11_big_fil_rev_8_21_14_0_20_39_10]
MNVSKKDLEKSQVELTVEFSWSEFEPFVKKGADKVSREVKIEGFRPGKAPYEILKQKIGEMTILEEAARIAINKTIDKVIKENVDGQPVGQPKVDIVKLAPDNPLEYKVVLALLPEVKLGDYKNLKIKPEKVEIKEDEINKTLEKLREMRVKEILADREARDTDKVIVNIKMFLDKVPVEGGQSQDTAILVGKNYLVPGFDKKIIGAKKGEAREFFLPYPRDHYQKNLAGQMVEFKVEIKEVYERQLPKLDDELAKTMQAKNLEDLKKGIKKNIIHQKEHEAKQKADLAILDKIMEKTKYGDIPEILVEHESRQMMAEMEQGIASQGGKFEDYLASIGKTRDQLTLDILPNAVKRVKSALVIREIALAENIKISEEDIDKKQAELIKRYKGYEKAEERIKEPAYREFLKNALTNDRVLEKLREWNVGD